MRTPPNERLTPDIAGPAGTRNSAAGKARADKTSERRCIVSGETGARTGMIRLAIAPSGLVLPDVQGKAPGRGAWIGATRGELEAAKGSGKLRGALLRAYKGGPKDAPLEVPEDLARRIDEALVRLLLDRLGLELRAGHLTLGTQRIDKAARQGKVALLLHASDASADGRKTLDQAWRVGSDQEGSGKRGLDLPLDRAALSVALGRDNVVHLALTNGKARERVMQTLGRLLYYRGLAPAPMQTDGAADPAGRENDEDLKEY